MESGLEKQFDIYIKKTIRNTIINYRKKEIRKTQREISFETLKNENDISVSFSFPLTKNIEDYFENEKLYNIVSNLKQEQKEILELTLLHKYNSKQIAKILKKSDSRIRHIYRDTLMEIKNKMKE